MVITWRLRAVSELNAWSLRVPEVTHLRTDGVGEMGRHPRVQSAGLGQRSGNLGEAPDLPSLTTATSSAAAAKAVTKVSSKPPVE